MNKIPLAQGRVARSKAGRDAGRLFCVIAEIDEDYVWIADGALRKLGRPKKKKRKHLDATRVLLAEGEWGADHLIRKALAAAEMHEEGCGFVQV